MKTAGFTVALVGPPNSGKSSLFNRLTGARQRIANYAGVTVEHREGWLRRSARPVGVLDLPGLYSLRSCTAEERISRDVALGRATIRSDLLACIIDATSPELGLALATELIGAGRRLIVVLTATDLIGTERAEVARAGLADALAVPVICASALRRGGCDDLIQVLDALASTPVELTRTQVSQVADPDSRAMQLAARFFPVAPRTRLERGLDRVTLHPVSGVMLLALVLFVVFQAVFSWSAWPSAYIEQAVDGVGRWVTVTMAPGAFRDLLTQAVIAGAGGVLVFLPPILLLFAFLVILEESGYLPRAAFLLDPLMARVGLSGRSLIPLLSSFACAVPGIMATRTISEPHARLRTMWLAPLMTCSARLPVYTLLIGAFVPARALAPGLNLQGLVLFALYAGGVSSALVLAAVAQRLSRPAPTALLLELPAWRRPTCRAVVITLRERSEMFLRRVGTLLLALSIVLWALTRFPNPPGAANQPAIYYSAAGWLGRQLQPALAPLGFDWQTCIALVPGLAAREVIVAALGTVYSAQDERALGMALGHWPLATSLALLTWFVFAPQCLSTLAVLRRETGGWRMPLALSTAYFAFAWIAAFCVRTVTLWWTGG